MIRISRASTRGIARHLTFLSLSYPILNLPASHLSLSLYPTQTSFGWLSFLVFCTAVLNAPVRPLLGACTRPLCLPARLPTHPTNQPCPMNQSRDSLFSLFFLIRTPQCTARRPARSDLTTR